jgi:hypothetical protein
MISSRFRYCGRSRLRPRRDSGEISSATSIPRDPHSWHFAPVPIRSTLSWVAAASGLLGGSNSWVESPPCAPARQPRSGRVVCPDLSVCRRAPHDVQANDLCRARRVDGLARGCPAHATRRRGKRHTEHNEAPFGLGSTSVGTECGRCCNTDVSASAKGVKALQALPVPEVGEHALRRCLWCRDFDLARPCPGSP